MNHPVEQHRNVRRWTVFTLLAAFSLLVAAPAAAWDDWEGSWDGGTDGYWDGDYYDDADGPGTEYRLCRSGAWATYNDCLVNAPTESDQKECDAAFRLDMMGCDLELIGNTLGKSVSFLKGIFK